MYLLKGPSFLILKVPIFYYIDQDYLTLFFCVESDLVRRECKGVTCNTYLRYIFSPERSDCRFLINVHSFTYIRRYSPKLKDSNPFTLDVWQSNSKIRAFLISYKRGAMQCSARRSRLSRTFAQRRLRTMVEKVRF